MTNTLQVIWKLQIKHEYFRDGLCRGIVVTPTPETKKLMARRKLLFRYAGNSEWTLVGFSGQEYDKSDVYEFYVQQIGGKLNLVTKPSLIVPGQAIILKDDNSGGVFQILSKRALAYTASLGGVFLHVQLELSKDVSAKLIPKTEIRFYASDFYWEYLIMFRNEEESNRKVQLHEVDNKLTFSEATDIEYMGKQAIKFRSLQKVQSQEIYTYKLQLLEVLPKSRGNVKNKQIPYPEPGMFLDTPRDTIQQIVYI